MFLVSHLALSCLCAFAYIIPMPGMDLFPSPSFIFDYTLKLSPISKFYFLQEAFCHTPG